MTLQAHFTLPSGAADAAAPAVALGAFWDAKGIDWEVEPSDGVLVAAPEQSDFRPRDITYASAWYGLFCGDELLHVGRSDGALYTELRRHRLTSEFAGRWGRFTWVQFREEDLLGAPSTGVPHFNLKISLQHVVDLFEEGLDLAPPPIGPSRPLGYPFPLLRFRHAGMGVSVQRGR